MKRVRLLSILAVAAATSLVTAACGSGPKSPFAPSQGATIQGTVVNATAAFSATGSAGIRVSAVGTSHAATTDAAGRFTLGGLPAGRAVLRFEGEGIDAQLEVAGLSDGQVLSINVRVSGSRAALTSSDDPSPAPSPTPSPFPSPSPGPTPSPSPSPGDDDEAEFTGKIQSISAPDLVVDGRQVRTNADTVIKDSGQLVSFSALQVGQTVEVEGSEQPDGSLLARKIHIEDDGSNDDNNAEVNFRGVIQSIAAPNLTVAGRTVVTTASTRFLDRDNNAIALSELQLGQTVEVEGTQQADQSVLAKKIKLED
jgi:hypothetical protein